ncbi:flavin reductase family protein [Alsobacter sp. SYSU M60028]|uniref:Flavin reductase family protein n=1 Tax=Alsobacter ponti TaxID=2962936 RepID=A0ABT1LCH7_9HYPH|nr:flavin reductase family protein [Alsobacter ponti]MCP8937953.1 flavin reductase family protein [Alsobacter ponti]
MTATPAHRAAGAAAFKLGMRSLVGAVTVVAVQGHQGTVAGLTATAVCSLSADPPSLLVCVNRSAALAPALAVDAEFSVNVLTEDQEDVAQAFGGQKPVKGAGRFVYGQWSRSEHDVPVLHGARVSFECVVGQVMDYGSHHIVVGRVIDVHPGRRDAKPLLYGDGRYLSAG